LTPPLVIRALDPLFHASSHEWVDLNQAIRIVFAAPPGRESKFAPRLRRLLRKDKRFLVEDGHVVAKKSIHFPPSGQLLEGLPMAVVDFETAGGGGDNQNRAIELGVVYGKSGSPPEGTLSSLVGYKGPIHYYVKKLTGIGSKDLTSAPEFPALADSLMRALNGRIFIAHNAPFDWKVLCGELLRMDGTRPLLPVLCTVKLSKFLYPMEPRHNLSAMCRIADIPITNRHRALGDAEATWKLVEHLFQQAQNQGLSTWDKLFEAMG